MVWVLSLSATGLSTRSLSPGYPMTAFGVRQGVVGGEAP
jgi:hypothetical protein